MKALDTLAEAFIAKTELEKDLGFFKEMGDRLDGKPAQAIVGEDGGALVVKIEASDAAL